MVKNTERLKEEAGRVELNEFYDVILEYFVVYIFFNMDAILGIENLINTIYN
jgi:hypothetical protein